MAIMTEYYVTGWCAEATCDGDPCPPIDDDGYPTGLPFVQNCYSVDYNATGNITDIREIGGRLWIFGYQTIEIHEMDGTLYKSISEPSLVPVGYDYGKETSTFKEVFDGGGIESLYKMTREFYTSEPFDLKDIYYDLREEVATAAVSGITKELATYSEKCFDRFSVLENAYVKMALPLPAALKRVFEGALELKLAKWMYKNTGDGINYDFSLVEGAEIIKQARGFGFSLNEQNLTRWCTKKIVALVKSLALSTTELPEVNKRAKLVTRLLDEAELYQLDVDRQVPEEELYMVISNRVMETAAALQRGRLENHAFHKQTEAERERYELCLALFDLAERFNFSPKIRDKLLAPYERLLSNDPGMWP